MEKNYGKLLVIDDDKLTLQIFEETLKSQNYDFDTAMSGKDALLKLDQNEYTLAICDVFLGDITGIEVLKHAKKLYPAIDVILVTAHTDMDKVLEALKFGASDYLKKPVSKAELLYTVEQIIERKNILNGYKAYKRYHELLQASQQISLVSDINALIHTSMEITSQFFKAKKAIFIEYKKDLKRKYKILGKQNIPSNAANTILSRYFNQNTIDIQSKAPTVDHQMMILPVFQGGHAYMIFLIDPLDLNEYLNHNSAGESQLSTDLKFLQNQISLTVKNIQNLIEAKRMAITDGLTGLRNQRYLGVCLDKELEFAKKHKRPLAVLFIDIDHFKAVNDKYGHLVGSKILCELAEVMKRSIRDPDKDKIIRYGGDEYVIILSNLDTHGALMVAERLRKRVENFIFLQSDKKIKLTISVGVSSYPETSFTKEEILSLADKALYEAKKISRNKVYSAKEMNL